MGSGSSFKLTSGEQFYIDIQPEDRLLIYLDQPDNQIRYGFNVISVLDGKELELFKLFEFVNGLKDHDLPPSVLSKILKLRFKQVVELDHAEYNAITKSLGHSYVEILPNTYHRKIVVNERDLNKFAFLSFKELMKIFSVKELLDSATFSENNFGSNKYIGISMGQGYKLPAIIGLYPDYAILENSNHLKSSPEDAPRMFPEKLEVHYFAHYSNGLPFSYYFSNQWYNDDIGKLQLKYFIIYVEKVSKGRFKYDSVPDPNNLGKFLYQLIDKGVQNQPLNQILYGPPGSGKTYNAVNHALSIALKKDLKSLIDSQKGNDRQRESDKEDFDGLLKDGQIRFVTFHQSYSYEDFVEGIKPRVVNNNIEYHIEPGVFKKICEDASAPGNSEKNYVLIIDEINRGNISKIFGELITLIEDSKRIGNPEELSINLVYSRTKAVTADPMNLLPKTPARFGVPNNVYIIGTMNTADKSIALVDLALRRRFTFIEYPADPTLLETTADGIDLENMLTRINERIEFLLDKDHSIGHSYLMGKNNTHQVLKVFRDKIVPLLCEYFHNDFKKISWVLGDHKERKDLEFFLVSKKELKAKDIFGFDPEGEFEGKEDEMYELKQIPKKSEVGSLLGIYLDKVAVRSKITAMVRTEEIANGAGDDEPADDS